MIDSLTLILLSVQFYQHYKLMNRPFLFTIFIVVWLGQALVYHSLVSGVQMRNGDQVVSTLSSFHSYLLQDYFWIGYLFSVAILVADCIFVGNNYMYKMNNLLIFCQSVFFMLFIRVLTSNPVAQFYYGWNQTHLSFLPPSIDPGSLGHQRLVLNFKFLILINSDQCKIVNIKIYRIRSLFMRKLLSHLVFKSSNWKKQILVIDGTLIDTSISNVPEQCLDNDVSPFLNINYLSKCEEDEETIKNKLQYKGVMIGSLSRLFVSIPTMHPQIKKFVNVHFLLDTKSPHTTLTHRALCAIHQRPFSTEIIFPRQTYQIGGRQIRIHLSNPNPTDKNPSHAFHSVNLLGMDFLRYYRKFSIDVDSRKEVFDLRLLD